MKVIIHGAAGAMGKHLVRLCENGYEGAEAVCLCDKAGGDGFVSTLSEFTGNADVLIDFSHHSAVPCVLDYCVERNIPAVIATTGLTEEEKAAVYAAGEKIPVFYTGNFSLGIAALVQLAKQAAAMFPEADIEIVEAHHNRKLDAPSGTALMIADGIRQVREDANFVVERSGAGKREKNDIGIHAIRMGNVVGMHEVFINTGTQTLTLKHEAHDRALFAEGALSAARFLIQQSAGVYNMDDITA